VNDRQNLVWMLRADVCHELHASVLAPTVMQLRVVLQRVVFVLDAHVAQVLLGCLASLAAFLAVNLDWFHVLPPWISGSIQPTPPGHARQVHSIPLFPLSYGCHCAILM